jgi:hypothetical protein
MCPNQTLPAPAEIVTSDYRGRTYSGFYPSQSSHDGPGWYVKGRGTAGEYDGRLRMICARPNVKPRRHPQYNCAVRRGWHTRREAQAIADLMNKES